MLFCAKFIRKHPMIHIYWLNLFQQINSLYRKACGLVTHAAWVTRWSSLIPQVLQYDDMTSFFFYPRRRIKIKTETLVKVWNSLNPVRLG